MSVPLFVTRGDVRDLASLSPDDRAARAPAVTPRKALGRRLVLHPAALGLATTGALACVALLGLG